MWTRRRMEKISWKEHKTPEELLGKLEEESELALIRTIRER